MPDAKSRARTQSINQFMTDCQQVANQFEQVFMTAVRLVSFYEDNNYIDTLTVEDFEPFRFNKEQLDQFMLMLQQVMLMAQGQQPAQLDYQQINNQIK